MDYLHAKITYVLCLSWGREDEGVRQIMGWGFLINGQVLKFLFPFTCEKWCKYESLYLSTVCKFSCIHKNAEKIYYSIFKKI